MSITSSFHFDTTTQFTWEGDAIALRQGATYIAKGYLSHWLSLFQSLDLLKGNEQIISIADSLVATWDTKQQAVRIQDSKASLHHLMIPDNEIHQFEESLLDLHQGCCGPVSFNFVADIIQEPDEILELLQDITSFKLSAPQLATAKASIATLPTEYEIDVLDLYNIWEDCPDLSYFAKALRFYFLSA